MAGGLLVRPGEDITGKVVLTGAFEHQNFGKFRSWLEARRKWL
jgi:hypothetical protein